MGEYVLKDGWAANPISSSQLPSCDVTPEMLSAGVVALESWQGVAHCEMIVREVYKAMAEQWRTQWRP